MSASSAMMLRIDEIAEVFHDVTPIPQEDVVHPPVCGILYPTSFWMAYDYMRACWKSKEYSERSLQLTASCLKLNPANYTVWHFRRECLRALGKSKDPQAVQADLDLTSQLGGRNPKNFQIWYHRRVLLDDYHRSSGDDETSPPKDLLAPELEYLAEVLGQDAKNYHAWANRQWALKTIQQPKLWDDELEFVDKLLGEDPWNNSAWSQRWFACHRADRTPLSEEVFRKEVDYAVGIARIDPYNEAPYRYILGILKERAKVLRRIGDNGDSDIAALYEGILPKIDDLKKVLEDNKRQPDECIHWISARLELMEGICNLSSLQEALKLAKSLQNELDSIREPYWTQRVQELEHKIEKLSLSS